MRKLLQSALRQAPRLDRDRQDDSMCAQDESMWVQHNSLIALDDSLIVHDDSLIGQDDTLISKNNFLRISASPFSAVKILYL